MQQKIFRDPKTLRQSITGESLKCCLRLTLLIDPTSCFIRFLVSVFIWCATSVWRCLVQAWHSLMLKSMRPMRVRVLPQLQPPQVQHPDRFCIPLTLSRSWCHFHRVDRPTRARA